MAFIEGSSVELPRRGGIMRTTYFQVIIAIILGIAVGIFWPTVGEAVKPLGDGFIKLVRMIIPAVIFLTVVTGVTGVREIGTAGRIAAKAIIYFLCLSTVALILGLVVANLFQPGAGMNVDPHTLDTRAVASYVEQAHEATLSGFVLAIIPDTLLSALTEGSILQVLLVAILFGVSISLVGRPAKPLVDLLDTLLQVTFKLVGILMWAAPIGAFGAIAFTIAKYGAASLINLGALIATFYLTSIFFVFGVLGLVAWLNGFSILRLIRYIRTELLLVLGTSSSEPALPGLIDKMERAGCARPVVGLVVPTGYSFNLDGTNIYMTLTALFIAQATNTHLTFEAQLTLLLVAMLSSKGAAGITGAGFITLAATLTVVPSVPVAGMALILGIDRFMSECRSLTNFIGNAVATIVVARWEGALDRDQLARALYDRPLATAGPSVIARAETE